MKSLTNYQIPAHLIPKVNKMIRIKRMPDWIDTYGYKRARRIQLLYNKHLKAYYNSISGDDDDDDDDDDFDKLY